MEKTLQTTKRNDLRKGLVLTLMCVLVLSAHFQSCQKEDRWESMGEIQLKMAVSENIYIEIINYIESLVANGTISEGTGNSLIVKVENAMKSDQKGNSGAALNQLNAALNEAQNLNSFPEEQLKEFIEMLENAILLSTGSFVDPRDGNEYGVVLIGNQIWMAENMNATVYADGSDIPIVVANEDWNSLSPEDKACCWFNNDVNNRDIYGVLYTWAAAINGTTGSAANPSGVQGVCPKRWHVPSEAEWVQMEVFLGGRQVSGGKLKEEGTTHWQEPNIADNSSGFTALPGGYRNFDGTFFSPLGINSYWWSCTESSIYAWCRYMVHNNSLSIRGSFYRKDGFYVRCIKD